MGNKVIDGGFYRGPNRWIDAGYADAAPASVTLVYNFLCRWAHNETWTVQQTMAAIRRRSGVRTERYIREALDALEAWGVISAVKIFSNRPTLWQLQDLPRQAPPYPTEAAKSRASTPSQSEGAAKGRNEGSGAEKTPPKESFTPSPSTGAPGTGLPSAGVASDPPYQTAGYQTGVNQTASIIASSGAEAPPDAANTVGEGLPPSAFEPATPMTEPSHGDGAPDRMVKVSRGELSRLVHEVSEVLGGHGYDHMVTKDQQHRMFRREPLEEILTDDQMWLWKHRHGLPF
jgi:hypothetical protein